MDAGLVKGEGFAVDASSIKADASRQRGVPCDAYANWSAPSLSTSSVREYGEELDEEALTETLLKRISLADPHGRRTAALGGPVLRLLYKILIDTIPGVAQKAFDTPEVFHTVTL